MDQKQCALRGNVALYAYHKEQKCRYEFTLDCMTDLIADLMHLCDYQGLSFDAALQGGAEIYNAQKDQA